MTIPPNSLLCEPQEVSILRPCDTLPVPKVVTEQHTTNASLAAKEPTDSITKELGVDIPESGLTEEQRKKATGLFSNWQSIFSRSPTYLGHTYLVRHEINLTEGKPFKEPYRRVAPALIQEMREHLAEMIRADAIRQSESSFSSNVVIVRKKDGTIRFCIDYRKLNSRTIKDAYAIPRIEDSLHLLAGSRY